MTVSEDNNPVALVALQNLTFTETHPRTSPNETSTGLVIPTPSDSGSIRAIAQDQQATTRSLDSVTQSLQRTQSTADVATSAGASVSDLLNQLKSKTLAASDPSLDATSRAALNADVVSLRNQISMAVGNASFNGANLIDSGAKSAYALPNASGASPQAVAPQNVSLERSDFTPSATALMGTATLAQSAISVIQTSITNANDPLANVAATENELAAQQTLAAKLQDTIDTVVGNLENANLAGEGAQLQSLQTKQRLGIQGLSVANASSSSLLSLFR